MLVINSFTGKNAFLSNLYPSLITYSGAQFITVEHAYQASKTLCFDDWKMIQNAKTPVEARKLGRHIQIKSDWDEQKLPVMEELLRLKFAIPELKSMLCATKDAILLEGNWWGDTFWGVCKGRGKNHLGELLMKIRDEILQSRSK